MQEEWRDLNLNAGTGYQVSNLGNVRCMKKMRWREVKQSLQSCGYMKVSIYMGKYKQKTCLVHRLVAEAFWENENKYEIVNHMDGNKLNNNMDNLEWCSYKQNTEHSILTKGLKKYYRGVIQYENGIEIARFKTLNEIEKILGIPRQNVSACCLGKSKTCNGYVWKYAK